MVPSWVRGNSCFALRMDRPGDDSANPSRERTKGLVKDVVRSLRGGAAKKRRDRPFDFNDPAYSPLVDAPNYVYIYISLSLSLAIYIYIYVYIHINMHMCVYIYIYIYMYVYMYLSLSLYLSISLSIYIILQAMMKPMTMPTARAPKTLA